MTKNLACRIFAEQINLIKQLPENERAIVLYEALTYAFNKCGYQNDNQTDNQIGNQVGYQNESAYISVSVSVYESLSEISKCVLDLLKKNIVCKEFSENYGGKREGAGSKKDKPNNPSGKNQYTDKPKQEIVVVENQTTRFAKPTVEDVRGYCVERNNTVDPQAFVDFYESKGWKIGKTPMKDWRAAVRNWERNRPVNNKKETTWEHNMRVMKEMEAENANESLF